jgi:hypothetical protein
MLYGEEQLFLSIGQIEMCSCIAGQLLLWQRCACLLLGLAGLLCCQRKFAPEFICTTTHKLRRKPISGYNVLCTATVNVHMNGFIFITS